MKLIGRSNRITRLLFFGIVTLVLSQSVSPSTSRTITTEYLFDDSYLTPVVNSRDTILYVGGSGPGNYSNIQDAVDNASDGDTIFIYQGIYDEHVVINKMINLIGENREYTIIDGGNSGNVIKISSNNVSITNITTQHGGIGVYIIYSSGHIIRNNIIKNNWEGIGLLQSSGSIISTNTISNNFFEGINPVQSSLLTISGNTISGNLQGVFLSGSTDNNLYGNTIIGNVRGIEIRTSSNNNAIYHNNFINNQEDNAFDECSNTWDNGYPSGGNYWDDYTGVDSDGDGIGDTSYPIPGGTNEDRYPLMDPWTGELPDLDCYGNLDWTDVEAGSTVTGSFIVENVGAPESELDWEIESYPDWGTWAFTPDSGEDLTPEDGAVNVTVFVDAPDEPETEYFGEVRIVNTEDPSDYCIIDVSLETPVSQISSSPIFQRLFERHPNVYLVFQKILGL